jgi:hypothetical protein
MLPASGGSAESAARPVREPTRTRKAGENASLSASCAPSRETHYQAGNSVSRVFDRDLTRPEDQPRQARPVTVGFRPR